MTELTLGNAGRERYGAVSGDCHAASRQTHVGETPCAS